VPVRTFRLDRADEINETGMMNALTSSERAQDEHRGCPNTNRGRVTKPWRVGRAFRRGELYVAFAWNFRVMIYTSDVSVRDAV
jgi:hypothetical protein